MMFNKSIIPLVVIFLISGSLILIFRKGLQEYGLRLAGTNRRIPVIYIITIVSMHLLIKGINASNTQAFLRHTYSGILVKLLIG